MKACPVTEKIMSSLDIEGSRIIDFPNRIFLCGGALGEENGRTCSRRGFFKKHLDTTASPLCSRILLAETVLKSFDKSLYADLLTFEKDIASLCALTVLFAESPGSLAELGSFAVFRGIQEKLLVVVDEDHARPAKGSFVWDGPITYLSNEPCNELRDPCLVYAWEKDENNIALFDKAQDHATHLEQFILDVIANNQAPKGFKADNDGHIMLLIADMLNTVLVATAHELGCFLKQIGLPDLGRKRIRQLLQLLCSMQLITKYEFGQAYYCSNSATLRFRFAFHKDAPVTTRTARSGCRSMSANPKADT